MAEPDNFTDQTIHASEEYRRAKRNVLFWASANILTSVGTASGGEVGLGSLTYSLSFPGTLLVIFTLVALLFMFLAYLRADDRLVAQNTELMSGKHSRNPAEAISTLNGRIGEFADDLDKLEGWRNTLTVLFAKLESDEEIVALAHPHLAEKLKAQWSQKEQMLSALKKGFVPEGDSGDQYADVLPEAMKWVPDAIDRVAADAALETAKSMRARINNAPKGSQLTAELQDLVTRIDELTAKISGFSNAIGPKEKRWFWAVDRGPVWLLSAVALATVFWRLAAPDTLDQALDRHFPADEIEAAQSSNPGTAPLALPAPEAPDAPAPDATPAPAATSSP